MYLYSVQGKSLIFVKCKKKKKKKGTNAVLTDSQTPTHCTIPRVPLLPGLCGWLHSSKKQTNKKNKTKQYDEVKKQKAGLA